jgi:hypothetical protein
MDIEVTGGGKGVKEVNSIIYVYILYTFTHI